MKKNYSNGQPIRPNTHDDNLTITNTISMSNDSYQNNAHYRENLKKMAYKDYIVRLAVILLIAMGLSINLGACSKKTNENLSAAADKKSSTKTTTQDTQNSNENNSISVYICGAVNNPGVYELKENSRIEDALKLAGGLAANADATWINLAIILKDEDQIYFPTVDEVNEYKANGETKLSASAGGSADVTGSNTNLVNINTATKDELMTLTGIGESKAQKIIDYRTKNGNFQTIEDLMNITGIKDGVFNKIKDDITV